MYEALMSFFQRDTYAFDGYIPGQNRETSPRRSVRLDGSPTLETAMATFESTYTKTFTLPVDLDAAKKHFADLATVIANSNDVETATVDGDVVHFVMKAQEHVGIGTFQSDYHSKYTLSGNVLTWAPVGEGNTRQSGTATFVANGESTEVAYSETLSVDMSVPKLMAPMLKPLIGAILSHEMKEYTARMIKSIEP
ncbi:MAG: hypothetical protein ACJAZO_005128 [Myxococcota bacterium]|jgi:hypothetical protein